MASPQAQWSLRSIARRAGEILRNEGFRPLLFRILGELGYRRVVLFERELPPPDDKACPPGVRYALLSDGNFDDFLAISQLCGKAEARRRLAAGQLCQLGYVDGEPASCCWLALPEQPVHIAYLGVVAAPAPGYGYIYELYVRPASRGTGLVDVGFEDRVRRFRKHGVRRMASLVMPENRPGMKHTLAAGFRPVGRIHRLRLLGLTRCWTRCKLAPPPMVLPPARYR